MPSTSSRYYQTGYRIHTETVVEGQVMQKQEFVEQSRMALEKYLRKLAAYRWRRKNVSSNSLLSRLASKVFEFYGPSSLRHLLHYRLGRKISDTIGKLIHDSCQGFAGVALDLFYPFAPAWGAEVLVSRGCRFQKKRKILENVNLSGGKGDSDSTEGRDLKAELERLRDLGR
ncbi:hypothetical protein LXL04_003852 [Taraxacum kok-saghyz]